MAHSPGPWTVCGWNNLVVNSAAGCTIVCAPGGDTGTLEEMQDNARLLASGPTLKALLTSALQRLQYLTPETFDNSEHEDNWNALLQDIQLTLNWINQPERNRPSCQSGN